MDERRYASFEKNRLNRLPTRHDPFDMCISFVNDKVYLCVKTDGVWFKIESTKV